jgi:hypothetical protein
MKNTFFNARLLIFIAFSVGFMTQIAIFAQTASTVDTTRYNVYAYMKVAPNMESDYLKMEKAYKKLHAASKTAGNLNDWSLQKVLSPEGTNCEYNYVARNGLIGSKQLANFYEGVFNANWQSLLTKEEIELVRRTDEIRSMVKVEVWSQVDGVFAEDWAKGTIVVWNYFSSPPTKTRAEHFKMEQDIWKPVHAARVKDRKMKGWGLLELELPFGAEMPYNTATIDLYSNMKEFLTPWFDTYFAKVHPGKDVSKLIQQGNAVTTLDKGELRMIIDRLDWKDKI